MKNFVHIKKSLISEALAQPRQPGKTTLEPLRQFSKAHGVPLQIIEDTAVTTEAEVHKHTADLWQCLDGEVVFVCGGNLVEPRAVAGKIGELKGSTISGGAEVTLQAGDWLWIPAGMPHLHSCKTTARLLVIKVPAA